MLSHTYQGNSWWIAMALFSLFMMVQSLLQLRTKRKAGFPVEKIHVVQACVMWLLFVAMAVYQVLTHR